MQKTASIENGEGESPFDFEEDASPKSVAEAPRFSSILFESSNGGAASADAKQPEFFRDLNFDQIVDAITAGREEYNLRPFFYVRLTDLASIAYRHEVMRDLEQDVLFEGIKMFSARMRGMRARVLASEKSYYKYQKEALFLEAAEIYCEAVEGLIRTLREHSPTSRGLLAFKDFLARYTVSVSFDAVANEAKQRRSELSAIRYAVLIRGSSITVLNYNSEPDYTASVEKTFAKFKQGAVQDYLVKFSDFSGMNHVEAMVLDRVALLNPEVFAALDDFCAKHKVFPDQTITDFDREVQFYVAWLEYAEKFKRIGLRFCYPRVSDTNKSVRSRDGFDIALAGKFIREDSSKGKLSSHPQGSDGQEDSPAIVCNDFDLSGNERILVVTGPNQGGKTTFARMFGQLHFLASLGCPVPGTEARLFLGDQFFAHFERAENITTLRGKLEDDLVRIHQILQQATPRSIIIINEIFSSTTLKDAVFLGGKVIERIGQLDALCVCVTFLDELSHQSEKTISLVAEVLPNNPTLRTFKIQSRPADGLAYALAIAEKYRLTYELLKERLKL